MFLSEIATLHEWGVVGNLFKAFLRCNMDTQMHPMTLSKILSPVVAEWRSAGRARIPGQDGMIPE